MASMWGTARQILAFQPCWPRWGWYLEVNHGFAQDSTNLNGQDQDLWPQPGLTGKFVIHWLSFRPYWLTNTKILKEFKLPRCQYSWCWLKQLWALKSLPLVQTNKTITTVDGNRQRQQQHLYLPSTYIYTDIEKKSYARRLETETDKLPLYTYCTCQCCVMEFHTPILPVWLVATSWLPMKNRASTGTVKSNVPAGQIKGNNKIIIQYQGLKCCLSTCWFQVICRKWQVKNIAACCRWQARKSFS